MSKFMKAIGLAGAVATASMFSTIANADALKVTAVGILGQGLVDGDKAYIEQSVAEEYIQHNPNIGDGLEGLGTFLGYLKENGISFSYKKIHNIVAEGNFVVTHREGEIGGKTNAFFDLFRVENGKIVEHRDVIQEVPTEMAHQNGMF